MAPIDNINRPTPSSSPPPNPPVGDGGPDDLEELVGNLDDEPTQPDPLSQRGYQPESTADRQHEIDEDDKKDERQRFIQEQLRQKEGEHVDEVAHNTKSAKNSFSKRFGGPPKPLAGNSSGQLGAKAAAKTEAKALAKAEAKVVIAGIRAAIAPFLPVILGALAVLAFILIVVIVISSLNAGGGNAGAGPASYPSTDAQREQATLLAALSGNKIANDQTVKNVIDDEKERYARIKANAQKYSSEHTAAIDQKIAEINPLLDSMLATKNKEERVKIRNDIQEKMLAFEGTLPFGDWIAKLAISEVGKDVGEFCRVTGAGRGVGCASFTSIILYDAGVPNAIVPTTMAVWNSKALRTVVERPANRSAQLWEQQKASLKPGDVIWWGDGSCSSVKYQGKLFDHVGFYVGNGEAVDTSSSSETVKKRPAAKRDSNCRYFNGAKRYGSN